MLWVLSGVIWSESVSTVIPWTDVISVLVLLDIKWSQKYCFKFCKQTYPLVLLLLVGFNLSQKSTAFQRQFQTILKVFQDCQISVFPWRVRTLLPVLLGGQGVDASQSELLVAASSTQRPWIDVFPLHEKINMRWLRTMSTPRSEKCP